LELGRASKEGSKKERKRNIPTSPRQKQNPKNKPPPLFIYRNLLVDDKKVGFY
jgi:hypothetical protein